MCAANPQEQQARTDMQANRNKNKVREARMNEHGYEISCREYLNLLLE